MLFELCININEVMSALKMLYSFILKVQCHTGLTEPGFGPGPGSARNGPELSQNRNSNNNKDIQ